MYQILDRLRPFSVLVARLVLGAIMVAHGSAKVFPHGALYNFTHTVSRLGMPAWLGYAAAFAELFGGALLILGFLIPIAAAGIAIDMAVAVLKVHLHRGLTGSGGFEYPLALFALALLIIACGPGYLAIDSAVFRGR